MWQHMLKANDIVNTVKGEEERVQLKRIWYLSVAGPAQWHDHPSDCPPRVMPGFYWDSHLP